MKKFFLAVAMYVLLACCPSFAQQIHQHTNAVMFQAVPPSTVPDSVAYSLWFAAAASDPALYQVQGVSQQDQGILNSSLSSFANSYSALVNSQNSGLTPQSSQDGLAAQRDAAVSGEISSLQSSLSASGYTWLSNTVQTAKNNVRMSAPATPCNPNQMCPNYSTLNTTTVSTAGTFKTTMVVQGTTIVNYSFCPACYSASHTVKGVLAIKKAGVVIAGGSFVGTRVTPPSSAINYTTSVSYAMAGCIVDETCPVVNGVSQPYIDCTVVGSVTGSTLYFTFDYEVALTRALNSGYKTGCYYNMFNTYVCLFRTLDHCTPDTTPPDASFQNKYILDVASFNWSHWDVTSGCVRITSPVISQWTCYGLGEEGFQTPGVVPLMQCTKNP